jgi:hypothetical protein
MIVGGAHSPVRGVWRSNLREIGMKITDVTVMITASTPK